MKTNLARATYLDGNQVLAVRGPHGVAAKPNKKNEMGDKDNGLLIT